MYGPVTADARPFCRRVAHHAGHGPGPAGRTVGPVLRPVQLRGRDREAGAEPAAGADHVVRPVGQRPGARAAPADQRAADAAAGRGRAAADAAPFHQVEAQTGVPHVVEPGGLRGRRQDGQPVLAGVAAHRRRPVRQQPRVARAHALQAHRQVAAPAADRAQSDRHRVSSHRAAAAAAADAECRRRRRRRSPGQKTEKQETLTAATANGLRCIHINITLLNFAAKTIIFFFFFISNIIYYETILYVFGFGKAEISFG